MTLDDMGGGVESNYKNKVAEVSMSDIKEKLRNYIDAGVPILYINSYEENKTDALIKEVIGSRRAFEWNLSLGVSDFQTGERQSKVSLQDYLQTVIDSGLEDELDRRILVIKDASSLLDPSNAESADVIALLKYICLKIVQGLDTVIIMVSSILTIPAELEKFITIIEPEYPDENEIEKLIQIFAEENQTAIPEDLCTEMSLAFKGLTEFEIRCILQLAIATKGELIRDDLKFVFTQKQQMIKKSGILEMIPLKEKPEDIGGLENLKAWLERKKIVFKNIPKAKKFGVDMPKGMLIAGVPGCGKSLTAKVTAQMFEVPLLRLDMGKILGKYVGESEANMRKAIVLAEAISPCVLWIDELEKAFAGMGNGGEGNEVTVRLFGTFLTWMQEKTSPVFVIATANDITKLPPELLRKGRFDEIFYVGLPNPAERQKIFEIHIGKRRKEDLPNIDIKKLVDKTDGYSGADIEGVVKDGVENTFSDNKDALTTEYILKAIGDTHSLKEIMKDSIDKLSKEYEQRKFKNASK